MYFDKDCTIVPRCPFKTLSISSINDLGEKNEHAISWTSDDAIIWPIYAHQPNRGDL